MRNCFKPRTSAYLFVVWLYDSTMEKQTICSANYENINFDQVCLFSPYFLFSAITNKGLLTNSKYKKVEILLDCGTIVWRCDGTKLDALGFTLTSVF